MLAAARGSFSGPPLDLRTEPKLDTILPEIEDWAWHVGVAMLIDADAVVVGEPQQLGDLACIDEVLDRNFAAHGVEITSIAGSVRATI